MRKRERERESKVDNRGPIGSVLGAAMGHEVGDWSLVEQLQLAPELVNENWLDAVKWADQCREQLLSA